MRYPKRSAKKPLKISRGKLQTKKELPPRLSSILEKNLDFFRDKLKNASDAVFRTMEIGSSRVPAVVIFIDGLVSKVVIEEQILKPLMLEVPSLEQELGENYVASQGQILSRIKECCLTASEVGESDDLLELLHSVLSGDTVLLIDGIARGLIISSRGWTTRGIGEPETESLIRGSREGFTETLRVNTSLIRRRLRNPDLKFENMVVGTRSKTDLVIVYIDSLVNKDVLAETKKRLETINIDGVLESGYIEQLIEDSFLSPFPQIQYTERPDKVVAALLEGRVALLLDGTPFALMVPATFPQFFQSPEDYYERWIIGSFTRTLRIAASYIAAFTPALYIAAASYHPGLIPTRLLLAIAASRQGVPFPPLVEAFMMELAFELFREAGARLPRPIGQSIGIVGGLIIGEAVVSANLASPIIVIIVAVTAIASFTIPSYSLAIGFRIIRFPLMFAAAALGLYGIMLGFIIINIHMVTMKSFGVSYLTPFAPYRIRDWKDLILRAPLKNLLTRPILTGPQDETRQSTGERE